jgi:hypothetical protein
MKKLFVGLGLFGCFSACYGLGSFLKNFSFSPRGTFFSGSPVANRHAITVPPAYEAPALPLPAAGVKAAAKPPVAPQVLAKAIAEEKGAALAQSARAMRQVPFRNLQNSLERRFAAEYPRNESEHATEVADRMGILQAMAEYEQQALPPQEWEAIAAFYEQIASDPDEPAPVQRERRRNQLRMIGRMENEEDRIKTLARSGRFLSSAAKPANELLESIFGSKP